MGPFRNLEQEIEALDREHANLLLQLSRLQKQQPRDEAEEQRLEQKLTEVEAKRQAARREQTLLDETTR